MLELYHGTSTKHLDKILKEGLLPKGNREGNWDGRLGQSNSGLVYLTDSYAPFYANASCKGDSEKPVIIKLFIDENEIEFFPDEETIFHCMKNNMSFKNDKEVIKFYNSIDVRNEFVKSNGEIFTWEDSLKTMGTVACEYVPKHFIESYYIGDMMQFLINCSDMVSPMNHKILGYGNRAYLNSLDFIKVEHKT